MKMDMKAFGARLREQRMQAGISQDALTRQTGIIQRDLSRLERGEKPALWADTLLRLAEALQVSVDYLLGLSDDPRPPKRPRPRTAQPVG